MRNSAIGCLVAALGIVPATATATVITQPDNFANEPKNEYPALKNPGTGSVGSGSWKADPNLSSGQHLIYLQGGSAGPLDPDGQVSYGTPGKNANLLFPSNLPLTIADIESIQWDTDAGPGSGNWFIDILTKPDGENDDESWYGKNFDLVPDNMVNTNAAAGFTTHTFDENGGTAYDDKDIGEPNRPDFTLSELKANYGSEEILFIAVATGTGSAWDNFGGAVDNFRFAYDVGDGVVQNTVDFEATAVPVPATIWMLIGGLFVTRAGIQLRRALADG